MAQSIPQYFVSNQLIAVSGGMADKRPFQTSTDGNCLFNSASIATFGDQSKAAELRMFSIGMLLSRSPFTVGYTDLIGIFKTEDKA
jgi:hypothetical protein